MEYCKRCIIYNEKFSELCAVNQDSTPENEKPKEHFCMIFLAGIPEDYWNGKKLCPFIIGRKNE